MCLCLCSPIMLIFLRVRVLCFCFVFVITTHVDFSPCLCFVFLLCVWASICTQLLIFFSLSSPELVESVICVNGTYGQVFHTGFQPFFRLPFMHEVISNCLSWFIRPENTGYLHTVIRTLKPTLPPLLTVYSFFFASKDLRRHLGENFFTGKFLGEYQTKMKTKPKSRNRHENENEDGNENQKRKPKQERKPDRNENENEKRKQERKRE